MTAQTSVDSHPPRRPTWGLASLASGQTLAPWTFTRRALRPDDVAVRITYCGVCHTDLHALQAGRTSPLVPGHEMVGEVTEVGAQVSAFSVGDSVAIGNIVDSCRRCAPCVEKDESYCREFPTLTYGGMDRHDGQPTYGGYSSEYVASADFVYHLPAGLDPAAVAPLLCAGVTTWSPLRRWKIGPGMTIGVVGLGGLGHMALKFARALGARVVVFTTSPGKCADALALGADEAIVSTDPAKMAAQKYRFNFILDTVSSRHSLDPYLLALNMDGTLCCLGIPDSMDFTPVLLTMGRRRLSSSGSAGTRETQEMLDFCAKHRITPDVEVIPASAIDEGFRRLEKGDVRYRLVIDMATLPKP